MQIDVLKAGWCKIGEKDGAKAIADLILFNTTLTTLDLRGNGLSNPGRFPQRTRCMTDQGYGLHCSPRNSHTLPEPYLPCSG